MKTLAVAALLSPIAIGVAVISGLPPLLVALGFGVVVRRVREVIFE
jgi:type III secretory pathway component EscV